MRLRLRLTRTETRPLAAALLSFTLAASAQAQKKPDPGSGTQADLAAARQELAAKHYERAKELYHAYLHAHPKSVDAQFGVADAELGLREFEAAEWDFRKVVAAQPQNWVAHKNLVIVEAELGRWDEFERERAVLRAARERGAPGISARESDVIDSFEVNGRRWIVREYYEPVGRSQTRYNFERFSPEGHAEEYISLEPTAAAEAALRPGDVRIGAETEAPPRFISGEFSLNWYSGKGHGTIAHYSKGEPKYERVRADLMRWLRQKP
jgi:tetratricopeptide (TPR) repeat protein